MATLSNIGNGGIANFSGTPGFDITLTDAVQRGSTVLLVLSLVTSGGNATAMTITDTQGNIWIQDIFGNRNTADPALWVYRSLITKSLSVGNTISVNWASGPGSGSDFTGRALKVDIGLNPVAQATIDNAFSGTVDVTFTRTAPDQFFFAAAAINGDADDAGGAGDAQWNQFPQSNHPSAVVWGAWRDEPAANDSWNAVLQQTRDFYGTGMTYSKFVMSFGGSQTMVIA